jgi:hypothetical protein
VILSHHETSIFTKAENEFGPEMDGRMSYWQQRFKTYLMNVTHGIDSTP